LSSSLKRILSDLAPGDRKSTSFTTENITFHSVESIQDSLFETAFNTLTEFFGARREMETRSVLEQRFAWNAAPLLSNQPLLHYSMILALDSKKNVAAVRDYSAIVPPASEPPRVTLHLSHLWIHPTHRRTGIAGWMRALPLETGRTLLAQAHHSPDAPMNLIAEIELPDGKDEDRNLRLLAYEKAGFLKVDPRIVPYLQPDFRDPSQIDASGTPQPIPMALILRRVGCENESSAPASLIRSLIHDLYTLYSKTFRSCDMAPLWHRWRTLPNGPTPISLLPPTQPES
jgi:GNAT superfamily N-acetyltransferase